VTYVTPPCATLDVEAISFAGFHWADGKWTRPAGAPKNKIGLPVVGAAPYWEHPTAEILCLSYRLPHWPVGTVDRWRPGQPMPAPLREWLEQGGHIEFHNAMFEKLGWHHVLVARHGWPPLAHDRVHCSLATAHVNGYPGALERLGEALDTDFQKDPDGKRLMDIFSKPRNPTKTDDRTRIYLNDPKPVRFAGALASVPELFDRYHLYCDRDVLAEESAADRMEPMTLPERVAWLQDQAINWRGLAVDRPAVRDCIAVLEQLLERYGSECERLTGGIGVSQGEKLLGWIVARGVGGIWSFDQKKQPLEIELQRTDLPDDVRRVLEIRALVGSAGVKKLYAIEHRASADDRLRGLFVHHGTRTGRPTGEGVQTTNLVKIGPKLVVCAPCGRPYRPDAVSCPWCGATERTAAKPAWRIEMQDHVLEIMAFRSLDMVEQFFGDVQRVLQGCIRGLFVAAPGHDLIASDYSAIEAVVAACISGEQWRIDVFRARRDIYLAGAANITGRTLDEYEAYQAAHGEPHPDRQLIGKISELACFGPLTQVLTNRGYVAIPDVLPTDRLWDGERWVEHDGVIFKGYRTVIPLDGVKITPDHLVNTNGFWLPASTLASDENSLCQALATGSASLPSSAWNLHRASTKSFCFATVTGRCFGRDGIGFAKAVSSVAQVVRESASVGIEKTIGAIPILSSIPHTVGASLTGSLLVSRVANPGRPTHVTAITAAGESRSTSHGQRERRGDVRFSPTSLLSPAGTTRFWKWIESARTAITNRGICGSLLAPRTCRINDPSSNFRHSSICTSRVYDIANAGPQNRFTIRTDSGHLLVHNCGFGGWIGSWRAFDPDEANKTDAQLTEIILAWREASPRIVEMWGGQRRKDPISGWWRDELYGIEGAMIQAIRSPGTHWPVGPLSFCYYTSYERSRWVYNPSSGWRVQTDVVPCDWLKLTLPSGRQLTYHQPRLRPSEKRPGSLAMSYMTDNTNPKYGALGWVRMDTWGSRVFENAVQAIAHDIQRFSMAAHEAAGYPIVQEVYDENVAEVPHGFGSIEEFEEIMSRNPPWAYLPDGSPWPIRASGGWVGRRYRKA
jgi:DNA polymerase